MILIQINQVLKPKNNLLMSMKSKWLGFPLIGLLISASIYTYINNDIVEDWLQENKVIISNEEIETLPIQSNERWIVLIVDFEDTNSNSQQIIQQTEDILLPDAQNYISQMSNNNVDLDIDIYSTIIKASQTMSYYGADNGGERDSSINGIHLPMALADEVIRSSLDDIEWGKYDLNSDGMVDRLLILHTSKGQEVGGNSNRIWSHFTTLDEIIESSNDVKIGHYAMAGIGSGDEGFGTIMHEMLHQMGAYDLYPSHGFGNSLWKGVGKWDIMASGNWNDGGRTPALPMSSTLQSIGLDYYENVTLLWNQENGYCQGPQLEFTPNDAAKIDYRIKIADGEYIWIENRKNIGYDSSLPGNGILLSYQDNTVTGFEDNELNINNERPYLKIIEADGNDDLIKGINEGELSDIFQDGDLFGSKGILIRDHDGVLVNWYAEVNISNATKINFKMDNCENELDVDLPDHSVTILLDESINFTALSSVDCTLASRLFSTDGRLISLSNNQLIAGINTTIMLSFNSISNANSQTRIFGEIQCENQITNLEINVLSLARIPTESKFTGSVDAYSNSKIDIPIDSIGDGNQNFEAIITGPLSRITSEQHNINLKNDTDLFILDIEPRNLLSNNMIVVGNVELIDSVGNVYVIDIHLTAESNGLSSLNDFISPGQMISLALIFAAIWVYLTIKQSSLKVESIQDEQFQENYQTNEKMNLDAWGRIIDD